MLQFLQLVKTKYEASVPKLFTHPSIAILLFYHIWNSKGSGCKISTALMTTNGTRLDSFNRATLQSKIVNYSILLMFAGQCRSNRNIEQFLSEMCW